MYLDTEDMVCGHAVIACITRMTSSLKETTSNAHGGTTSGNDSDVIARHWCSTLLRLETTTVGNGSARVPCGIVICMIIEPLEVMDPDSKCMTADGLAVEIMS